MKKALLLGMCLVCAAGAADARVYSYHRGPAPYVSVYGGYGASWMRVKTEDIITAKKSDAGLPVKGSWLAGAGVGMNLNPDWRLEFSYTYKSAYKATEDAPYAWGNHSGEGLPSTEVVDEPDMDLNIKNHMLLGQVYYDFLRTNWNVNWVRSYIGLGGGATRSKMRDRVIATGTGATVSTSIPAGTLLYSRSVNKWYPTAAATLGCSFGLSRRTFLDISARYAYIFYNDRSIKRYHNVDALIGLRFNLW
ncbi:MAG: outer membrane beta-barrel protein [Alphaproteobacteria bacterium]|nr:outer membrane beta-barrel protein [Alphaproteobacteria bacterium]